MEKYRREEEVFKLQKIPHQSLFPDLVQFDSDLIPATHPQDNEDISSIAFVHFRTLLVILSRLALALTQNGAN